MTEGREAVRLASPAWMESVDHWPLAIVERTQIPGGSRSAGTAVAFGRRRPWSLDPPLEDRMPQSPPFALAGIGGSHLRADRILESYFSGGNWMVAVADRCAGFLVRGRSGVLTPSMI